MGLLLIVILLIQIQQNKREECERVATPEPPPLDRSTAVWVYRSLFIVCAAIFYFHTDWSYGPPADSTILSRAISATLVFYIFVGLPLWICVEMENKDFKELNEKTH